MNQIKFRQRHNGKWHYWGFLVPREFTGPANITDYSYQSTSRYDINKEEIYEGDIVIINEDDDEFYDEVVRDKNWLELSKFKGHSVTNISLYETPYYVRIIGNIEQNPEMRP